MLCDISKYAKQKMRPLVTFITCYRNIYTQMSSIVHDLDKNQSFCLSGCARNRINRRRDLPLRAIIGRRAI